MESLWSEWMQSWKKRLNTRLKISSSHHFLIADTKRGDIGNTSTMYAKAF
jgi:orotidine-5'-phosphate decarboxylase